MFNDNEEFTRREICRIGNMLHHHGYVAACDGNISVRLREDVVLCTPTSISKGMMEPEDLVKVTMSGAQIGGERHPSTELGMHLLFYRMRPEIRAVVHAHPPTATGFAAAATALDPPLAADVAGAVPSPPPAGSPPPRTPQP